MTTGFPLHRSHLALINFFCPAYNTAIVHDRQENLIYSRAVNETPFTADVRDRRRAAVAPVNPLSLEQLGTDTPGRGHGFKRFIKQSHAGVFRRLEECFGGGSRLSAGTPTATRT